MTTSTNTNTNTSKTTNNEPKLSQKFDAKLSRTVKTLDSLVTNEIGASEARKQLKLDIKSLLSNGLLSEANLALFTAKLTAVFSSLSEIYRGNNAKVPTDNVPGWHALRNAISLDSSFSALYSLSLKSNHDDASIAVTIKVKTASKVETLKDPKDEKPKTPAAMKKAFNEDFKNKLEFFLSKQAEKAIANGMTQNAAIKTMGEVMQAHIKLAK